jgi:CBS domain containing-hemolysin-like protein
MSGTDFAIWTILMLIGFTGSALYSGLETGAYSLNRVRLHILDHQNNPAARSLRRLIDHPTTLLTTLLIGNNISNYLGTASLAVILEGRGFNEWQTILLNTLIVTPILFVFGETLPKDLFAAYSDRLMYRLVTVTELSRKLFTLSGLIWLIGGVTGLLMKALGQHGKMRPLHPRRRVEALVREGVGYGLLSDDQSAIVERVLNLTDRRVRDEMVPWAKVIKVQLTDPPSTLWNLATRTSRSRFPIVDKTGAVVGVVNVMDALLVGPDDCPPIEKLMDQPYTLPASYPSRKALAEMQKHHVALALVADAAGHPVGIVTMKDLIEPITGELWSW